MSSKHGDDGDRVKEQLDGAWEAYNKLYRLISKNVFGHERSIRSILTAFFSGGHVLLEDYPGSGKSYLAVWLGKSISDDVDEEKLAVADQFALNIEAYNRIQCTPDLLPSDITGYTMPKNDKMDMEFRRGPIFAYVLLLDEINRTTPKVQSAMLEAMAEKQVTVDSKARKLGKIFFVIATQNPLDHKGTYELPAAQLDRFLFKIVMQRMSREDVKKVMESKPGKPEPVIKISQIIEAIEIIDNHVTARDIEDPLLDIRDVIIERMQKDLKEESIPSARALQRFITALKVAAFARVMTKGEGDLKVEAEDVRLLSRDFFRHRIYPDRSSAVKEGDAQGMNKLIDELVAAGLERHTRKTRDQ